MHLLVKFLLLVGGIAVQDGIRYLMLAGLAWLAGCVLFRNRWLRREIIQSIPRRRDVLREMALSASTVLIYGLVGAAPLWAWRRGWTRMYLDFDRHGMVWFWCSVALTIVLHDAYFYWTHRLMGTNHEHYEQRFREVTSRLA